MKLPELLAPAGNLEKLKTAFAYGADAVYCGAKDFNLRAQSQNFEWDELETGIQYAHSLGKKVYVTVNLFAHNSDLINLPSFLRTLQQLDVDAVIVSDPGVLRVIKRETPQMEVHLSTQANTTNWESIHFWQEQGIQRVILARELHRTELYEIAEKTDVELEIFVHGAICMAYSGRCFLSHFYTQRDANRGNCSQPCRWKYHLVEETRPGVFMPMEETERGTFFLSAYDLNLLDFLPELVRLPVRSVKIEGRMKGIYYVANVTRVYRAALTAIADGSFNEKRARFQEELANISHRFYSAGFYDEKPEQVLSGESYLRGKNMLGEIQKTKENWGFVKVRGKFQIGETIECIAPQLENDFSFEVTAMQNEYHEPVTVANPNKDVWVKFPCPVTPNQILRKD